MAKKPIPNHAAPEAAAATPVKEPTTPTEPEAATSTPVEEPTRPPAARDMNDPRNRRPGDKGFIGQGLDPAPYGKKGD